MSQRRAKGRPQVDIKQSLRLLADHMSRTPERTDGPMTARLADESDDGSPVEIVNRHGHVVAVMSQANYATLTAELDKRGAT